MSEKFNDNLDAQVLEELLDPGEWIQFPKIFFKIFTGNQAIFLAFLLNYRNRFVHQERYKKYEGWFFCSIKNMEKELGMNKSSQHTMFRMLKRLKIIETKVKGIPPKRWIKINFHQILENMKSVGTQNENPRNS